MHWDGERPAYPLSSQRPPSIFLSVDISFKEDIPTIEGGPLGLPEGAVLYTWNGLRIRIRSTKVFVFNAGWVGMLFNRSEETAGSLDSANQQRKSTAQINSANQQREAGITKLRQIPKGAAGGSRHSLEADTHHVSCGTFYFLPLGSSPVGAQCVSVISYNMSVVSSFFSHTCRYAAVLGRGAMVFYHLVSLLDVSLDDLRTYVFISYGKCPLFFSGAWRSASVLRRSFWLGISRMASSCLASFLVSRLPLGGQAQAG